MRRLCSGAVLVLMVTCVSAQSLGARRMPFQQLLHKTISGVTPATTNVVFSPYSVATALTLLQEAAAGSSRREISDVLGRGHRQALQSNVEGPGVTLRLWNAFYHDKTLAVKPAYITAMQRLGASVQPQPFTARPAAAVSSINSDVSREALGKIGELLPAADPNLIAVLVSAIYFRAEWRTALDPRRTRPGAFTTADGRRQTVDMMSGDGQYRFLRSELDSFTSVAMPYKDERFQMILVLPDREANINDIISRFDANLMYKQMRTQRVIIKFPKFRVETKLALGDVLKRLGIREVFTSKANLRGMSPDPRLYVSSVRHSAVIETDEKGSEAAAATAVGISARSFFTPPTPSLIANRPFLFFVYDVATANVLFGGQISDAAAAQNALPAPAPAPVATPAPAERSKLLAAATVPRRTSRGRPRPQPRPQPQPQAQGQFRAGQTAPTHNRSAGQGAGRRGKFERRRGRRRQQEPPTYLAANRRVAQQGGTQRGGIQRGGTRRGGGGPIVFPSSTRRRWGRRREPNLSQNRPVARRRPRPSQPRPVARGVPRVQPRPVARRVPRVQPRPVARRVPRVQPRPVNSGSPPRAKRPRTPRQQSARQPPTVHSGPSLSQRRPSAFSPWPWNNQGEPSIWQDPTDAPIVWNQPSEIPAIWDQTTTAPAFWHQPTQDPIVWDPTSEVSALWPATSDPVLWPDLGNQDFFIPSLRR